MASESGQGAVIDITVKTLDGQNRTFSVPENLNVRQFKEKISSSIEIPADTQRLIFQGRVMQDDKILKDYNVHDKVIHLVQRAPPTTLSSTSTSSPTTTSTPSTTRPQIQLDGNLFDVQIHLGRLQSTPNTREARARLRQADFNLRLVNDVLSQFERLGPQPGEHNNGNGQAYAAPSFISRPVPAATVENRSENRMDTSSPLAAVGARQSEGRDQPQQSSSETVGGLGGDQQAVLMATELANFLDQVVDTNSRVLTHIRQYQDLLRNEQTYPVNSTEAQNAQDVVNRVAEIFHALGHMLHSLSDITVDMSTNVPRQAIASPPVPFQIPGTASMAIPIHMNVRTRQDGSRSRPRSAQPASTPASGTNSRATTTSSGAVAASQNSTDGAAAGTTSTPGISTFQMPPLSLPLSQSVTASSGDSTVMVFPTSVTVHDIRAVVTQAGMDVDSDSSTDSAESLGGNRANITVTSSTTADNSSELPAATTNAAAATSVPSSTAPAPPSSTPQTAGASPFTTSTSTFTFGPTTGVSFGGATNFGAGQLPNVPGLPPGMLQNILGSLLSSQGMRPGQPVQVNVVQQVTTSGGPPSRPPQQQQQQQPIQDLPLDSDRPGLQYQREPLNQNRAPAPATVDAALQTTSSVDASMGTSITVGTNTASTGATGSTNASTNTSTSANAATNTTSTAGSGVLTSSFNLSSVGSQSSTTTSSLGTRTDPTMGTSSRSTNTPRPFLFHAGPPGQTRQQPVHARPQQPGPLRPVPGSHGYVDPYLPCASPQYMSQTALAALNALQGQTRGQQTQQQVPNLSTMVSGMVGEIIEQVGQASQQALHSGARTSSSSTMTSTSSNSSSAAGTTTTSNSGGSGQHPAPANPFELFAQLLGVTGGSIQAGSVPPEFGALISGTMQAMSAQATAATAAARGNSTAPPTWTLAELFSQVRNVSGERVAESGVIISLLEAVAPHIGVTDLFSLVMGNAQVITRIRRPLYEFVKSLVDRHGSVDQVVEITLNDMYADIQHIQSLVQVKEGIDMARSIYNCLRAHLTTIFTAINSDSTGAQGDFGSHLYVLWVRMLAESIALCVYCIRDGQAGFLSMLQNYMPRMTQGMGPVFTDWMTAALQSILGSFCNTHPVPESDIIGYVVNKSDTTTVSSSQDQNRSESETSVSSSLSHSEATVVSHISMSGTSPQASMDARKPPASQPPKAKIARTLQGDGEAQEVFEDAQEMLSNHQPPVTHPSTLATQVAHTEGAVGGSRDLKNGRSSNDWQSVIPQEWIPVISRDIVKQQEQRPQPPFSDAYLQGLPAKRRRMMTLEHAHEMGNMQHYLPESLRRAARTAGVTPYSEENMAQEAAENLDLQAALERELTDVMESRITSDSDFSPDRFPNAEDYFHKSKNH